MQGQWGNLIHRAAQKQMLGVGQILQIQLVDRRGLARNKVGRLIGQANGPHRLVERSLGDNPRVFQIDENQVRLHAADSRNMKPLSRRAVVRIEQRRFRKHQRSFAGGRNLQLVDDAAESDGAAMDLRPHGHLILAVADLR